VGLTLAVATTARADAPPTVTVCRPAVREVQDYLNFNGTAEAAEKVTLRARATGTVEKVHFREGTDVKKDEVLFTLDNRLARVQYEAARVQLERAKVALRQAETARDRLRKLADRGVVDPAELERVATEIEVARLGVAAAEAAVREAELSVDAFTVRSPIDGRIGRALVTAGNRAKADDTELAVVLGSATVLVSFPIPADTYQAWTRSGALQPGKRLQVNVLVGQGQDDSRETAVDFIDNHVENKTGTVLLRARLANPDGTILPGQGVRVRVADGPPRKGLFLPVPFPEKRGEKPEVLVVSGKDGLAWRSVECGRRVGELIEVRRGLKADDRVVIGGEVPDLKKGPFQFLELPVPAP
jgi:multidrug efflux system membrane fusion protein